MEIMGIKINEINRKKARILALEFLMGQGTKTIFTPNPEMLVDAQTDISFRKILNSGDLNICDGRGVELVSHGRLSRIPGIDFMYDICHMAQKYGKKVFLLGSGNSETIDEARKNIQKVFPDLEIVGFHKGPDLSVDKGTMNIHDIQKNEQIIENIISKKPDILFVGFGHNKQERWINAHINKFPFVKIAMGVGGSFDMISGKIKRAPKIMQRLGLEWFWRLVKEPWRIQRIWKATGLFLYMYITRKKEQPYA